MNSITQPKRALVNYHDDIIVICCWSNDYELSKF
jgi:hypothetical protein